MIGYWVGTGNDVGVDVGVGVGVGEGSPCPYQLSVSTPQLWPAS